MLYVFFMALCTRLHGWGGFPLCRLSSQIGFGYLYFFFIYQHTGNLNLAAAGAVCAALAFNLANEGGFPFGVRTNGPIWDIIRFLKIQNLLRPDLYKEYKRHIFFLLKGMIIALVPAIAIKSLAFFAMTSLAWPISYAVGFHLSEKHHFSKGFWSTTYDTYFPEVICGLSLGFIFRGMSV